MLDTSVVVRRFRDGTALTSHFSAFEEFHLPQTARAEIDAGAYCSPQTERNLQQIERFLEAVDVLLTDEATPEIYGRIPAQLAQAGTPIPQNDIWIAAIAPQSGLPLATYDSHFTRVAGLQILLW